MRPALDEQQVPITLRREQRRQIGLGVVEELAQVACPVCGVGDDREALIEPVGDQSEEQLVLTGEA